MKKQREHKYVLGYTIETMEACKKYVLTQYETFRKLVFNAFIN